VRDRNVAQPVIVGVDESPDQRPASISFSSRTFLSSRNIVARLTLSIFDLGRIHLAGIKQLAIECDIGLGE
jgi:hypothetical protein